MEQLGLTDVITSYSIHYTKLYDVERDNGEIILICEDRRVYSINSYTGNINWKIKPGGKLSQLLFSLDGSIIIRDEKKIYSIFGSGKIRWSKESYNFV